MKKMVMIVMMAITMVASATNAFAYDIPAEGTKGSYERFYDTKGKEHIKTTWYDENGNAHGQEIIIEKKGIFEEVTTITY